MFLGASSQRGTGADTRDAVTGSELEFMQKLVLRSDRRRGAPGSILCYHRLTYYEGHHYHHHQFLNSKGRWGTTDDFATSFLHFPLFSTALTDLPNSTQTK